LLLREGCFTTLSDEWKSSVLSLENDTPDEEVQFTDQPVMLGSHIQDVEELDKAYLSRVNAIVVAKVNDLKDWGLKLLLHSPKEEDNIEEAASLTEVTIKVDNKQLS